MKPIRVRTTVVFLCTVLSGFFAATPVAKADQPTRQPNPIPTHILTDTQGHDLCQFPVEMAFTTNKEVISTFVQKSGATHIIITGAFKVRLTRMNPRPDPDTYPTPTSIFIDRSSPDRPI